MADPESFPIAENLETPSASDGGDGVLTSTPDLTAMSPRTAKFLNGIASGSIIAPGGVTEGSQSAESDKEKEKEERQNDRYRALISTLGRISQLRADIADTKQEMADIQQEIVETKLYFPKIDEEEAHELTPVLSRKQELQEQLANVRDARQDLLKKQQQWMEHIAEEHSDFIRPMDNVREFEKQLISVTIEKDGKLIHSLVFNDEAGPFVYSYHGEKQYIKDMKDHEALEKEINNQKINHEQFADYTKNGDLIEQYDSLETILNERFEKAGFGSERQEMIKIQRDIHILEEDQRNAAIELAAIQQKQHEIEEKYAKKRAENTAKLAQLEDKYSKSADKLAHQEAELAQEEELKIQQEYELEMHGLNGQENDLQKKLSWLQTEYQQLSKRMEEEYISLSSSVAAMGARSKTIEGKAQANDWLRQNQESDMYAALEAGKSSTNENIRNVSTAYSTRLAAGGEVVTVSYKAPGDVGQRPQHLVHLDEGTKRSDPDAHDHMYIKIGTEKVYINNLPRDQDVPAGIPLTAERKKEIRDDMFKEIDRQAVDKKYTRKYDTGNKDDGIGERFGGEGFTDAEIEFEESEKEVQRLLKAENSLAMRYDLYMGMSRSFRNDYNIDSLSYKNLKQENEDILKRIDLIQKGQIPESNKEKALHEQKELLKKNEEAFDKLEVHMNLTQGKGERASSLIKAILNQNRPEFIVEPIKMPILQELEQRVSVDSTIKFNLEDLPPSVNPETPGTSATNAGEKTSGSEEEAANTYTPYADTLDERKDEKTVAAANLNEEISETFNRVAPVTTANIDTLPGHDFRKTDFSLKSNT